MKILYYNHPSIGVFEHDSYVDEGYYYLNLASFEYVLLNIII